MNSTYKSLRDVVLTHNRNLNTHTTDLERTLMANNDLAEARDGKIVEN